MIDYKQMIENNFKYHKPNGDQPGKYEAIRAQAAEWNAKTWQRKAGYNETKPHAEWIKHDKGFFRLRAGMDYTPWFTYLLDPDTIIEICNLENAKVEWKADYECSMCGSRAWEEETNYCPNCGAKMNA